MEKEIAKRLLKGIPASPGIAIGKACVFQDIFLMVESRNLNQEHVEQEVVRLKQAVRQVAEELLHDNLYVSQKVGKKEAEIFLAHVAILEDPYFISRILKDIRKNGVNAEAALLKHVDKFSRVFERIEDPYFREKGSDLRDIGRRVAYRLMNIQQNTSDLKDPAIIVASELSPSDTVGMDKRKVLAFATESGGKESHAAILSQSLGIPAVVGLGGLLSKVNNGDSLIVDGDRGLVVIDPPEEIVQTYRDLKKKHEFYRLDLEKIVPLPSKTLDDHEIRLWANIGSLVDLEYALHFGAYGIGLFRTELPFLVWRRFLSENEQFSLYQKVMAQAGGREVTIRTLDFGGGKFFKDKSSQMEKNPFLGYRSIRVFLREKGLFKQQLRAILRASAYGHVKILFPMISSIEEVRQVRELFESTKRELRKEGLPFDERIPFGIMIEIPSVAIMAHQLVSELDFLSIGTNDLTQYTMAADRTNNRVARIYNHLHPSVLRLIRMVVDAAHSKGRWVGVCGEMAGDPQAIPILLGLDIDELSMAPQSILEAKHIIRSIEYKEAKRLAEKALAAATLEEVLKLTSEALKALKKKPIK